MYFLLVDLNNTLNYFLKICNIIVIVQFSLDYKAIVFYKEFFEKGSDQPFVTLYTLSIYPSVHSHIMIRTFFEAHIVA